MNLKSLLYLCVLGIFALAVVCYVQLQTKNWQHNQIEQLNIAMGQKQAIITDRQKTLRDKDSQIDDLNNKLSISDKNIADAETKFAKLADERDQIAGERDKVVSELQKWQDAVAQRDAALKIANNNIAALTADRNDAVQNYNDVAKQYNDLMAQFNALRATTQ